MGQIIRQSTAITVAIGPFLDSADGNTIEDTLTITQPDVRLSKNGAAFAQKSAAQTLAHMENGYYSLSLSTTDTDAVGMLTVHVHESGALPVFHEFQVVEEAVYDILFVAAATGAVPVASIAANAITAAAIATGAIDADALAADTITAAKIATDAIGAAEIAADAIGASELAAGAVTEIVAAVVVALKDEDRRGTAQAGGATTITLAAGDAEADDFYNGSIIVLLEGTGTSGVAVAARTRRITDYVNSTNVATVDAAWATNPAAGTVYLIVGG